MKNHQDFIGREKEQASLEDRYRQRKSQFVVVYGRRRVGKSALLRHFCSDKHTLFHVGDRSTKELQIKKILEAASRIYSEPLLSRVSLPDWGQLFETLTPHLLKKKTVLVLDEFQWMCEGSPELPSVIQQYWDSRWEKSGRVFLILCGSYMGFMEREVLGKKSPLFGRRTSQMKIQPFTHRDARLFHPRYKVEDSARLYAICGGIPAYLLAFSDDRSIDENILGECLEDNGRLREEPRFLTMEELREPAIYYSLLETLHTRRLRITELGKQLGIEKGNLVYYLKTLQQLGYVEKVFPLGIKKGGGKRPVYQIQDPLLRFWFSLVYPNLTDLTMRQPRDVFISRVKPKLAAYYGIQFETLCREALPRLLHARGVTAPFKIGSYWDNQTQIDIVVEREDGLTHLAECKWQARPVGMETVEELKRKIMNYPNPNRHNIIPQIFSQSGFTETVLKQPHIQCFTVADLFHK